MKKIIFSMAVLLVLGSSVSADAQRHRHTPRTETVAQQDGGGKKSVAADKDKAVADNSEDEGIEAYSDTSSTSGVDTAANSYTHTPVDESNRYSPSRFDDPFSWLAFLCSTSFVGVLITILVIVVTLLFLFMPLIIVLLILRYFVRRHNDRMRLAEKAMADGRPIDEQMPLSRKSPETMWRRGVRHFSIGVGLMVFFWFLGADSAVGIGGLLACMGAGQIFMARYSHNSKFGSGRKEENDDFFDRFEENVRDLKFGDDKDKFSGDKDK